jgi:hypothetical protein
VFNATPGRLTKTEGHYSEIATPRPSTASSHNDLLLATTDIDPADQIHFSASKNSPLPYANLSNQFPSFSHPSPSPHGTPSEDKKKVNTPRKPTRRLQEAFAGQTPTPPHSANRPARKLVPKPARPTMQSGEDSLPQQQGASAHPNTLSISSQNQSIYSYPMSAPVTAPGYMGGKNFWDPDTTMSGMSMDMDFMTANTGFFDPSVQDPFHNPINWNQNNGMAPSNLDMTSFSAHSPHPTGSNGAFAPKQTIPHTSQPERSTTLLQGVTTSAETSFSILASSGGVDPGLLFSFHETNSPVVSRPATASSTLTQSQVSHHDPSFIREPYQHQRREIQREQEEYQRSRVSRGNAALTSFSSPLKKGLRPGLSRSNSDSRARLIPASQSARLGNIAPRMASAELKSGLVRRQTSPTKRLKPNNLGSIPESVPGPRTAIEFTIDEKGRARTETRIILEDPPTVRKKTPSIAGERWGSDPEESSSDDEPIIVPSGNNSFTMPTRRFDKPRLGNFDTSFQSTDHGYRDFGDAVAPKRRLPSHEEESEAETVMEDNDGTGNAANALRKVLESRKQASGGQPVTQANLYSSNQFRHHPQLRPSYGQQYYNSSPPTNLSPTTVSDPDLATPTTDRGSSMSDSTRCICHSRDGDPFMIQW